MTLLQDPRLARVPVFLAVGAGATAAYALLYLGLRELLAPQWANAVALVLSTLLSTAGNRRVTFGCADRATAVSHHALGLVLVVAGLGLTSGSLDLLAVLDPTAGRWAEVAVLALANAAVGTLRYVTFSVVMRERTTWTPPVQVAPAPRLSLA